MNFSILEARILLKQLVHPAIFANASVQEKERMVSYEEVPIAIDYLEDLGITQNSPLADINSNLLDFNAPRREAVELKKQLEQYSNWDRTTNQNNLRRLNSIIFRTPPFGKMGAYKAITLYNVETIKQLCKFLNISFPQNTKIISYNIDIYFSSIKPEHIQQAVSEVLSSEAAKIITATPLTGRGAYRNRIRINDRLLSSEIMKSLEQLLPNDNGYFHFEIVNSVLRRAFQLATGRVYTYLSLPERMII